MFSHIYGSREFWIGLDKMYEYTKSGDWKLKVEIKYDVLRNGAPSTRAGTWGVGEWDNFAVASEANKYRLTIGSRTKKENMGVFDSFYYCDGMYFSTKEDGRDNDNSPLNCAQLCKGSWWFNNCAANCLNCKRNDIWHDGGDDWEKPSTSLMWMKRTD